MGRTSNNDTTFADINHNNPEVARLECENPEAEGDDDLTTVTIYRPVICIQEDGDDIVEQELVYDNSSATHCFPVRETRSRSPSRREKRAAWPLLVGGFLWFIGSIGYAVESAKSYTPKIIVQPPAVYRCPEGQLDVRVVKKRKTL